MAELLTKDLHWILRRTPKCVVNLMERTSGCFMAGGFIRACVANEEASDVDLFAPDEERARLYANALVRGDQTKILKTKNAYTVRRPDVDMPIQVIHRWTYTKPEDLVESFDFTIAKSVIWCTRRRDPVGHRDVWGSLTHEHFYADLSAKRLTYTRPQRNEDAGGSLLRVLKFYQKGYRIPLDSMGDVIARIVMGLRMDELAGMPDKEVAVAEAITGLLHEVDPVQDPQHLFHLPSTITEE